MENLSTCTDKGAELNREELKKVVDHLVKFNPDKIPHQLLTSESALRVFKTSKQFVDNPDAFSIGGIKIIPNPLLPDGEFLITNSKGEVLARGNIYE